MWRKPLIQVPRITEDNRKMFFWPAAFYLYFSYTLTGAYPFFEPWHPAHTDFDAMVPFLPGTIWIYLSHIGMLFTGWWWVVKNPGCTRMFWALVLGAVIATFYFFFFPTELPRRELADVDAGPVTSAAWAFLLSADNPTNSFPSMHVALSGITAIGLMRSHPHWGWLAPVWTAAIAVSTMTTEQHVLVDVLGGIGLAVFCVWFADTFIKVVDDPTPFAGRTASD